MKIAYINPMSYSNSALYDYNILTNLDKEKSQIIFLGSKYYDANPINNISFYPIFNYNKLTNKIKKAFSYSCSLIKAIKLLSNFRPQVVHIQWTRIPAIDLLLVKILHLLNCKVVYTAHNVLPHNDNRKSTKEEYKRYYKEVDAIITHASSSKKELIETFYISSEKIFVVPHGLIQISHNTGMVNQIMSELNTKYQLQNKFIISSIGLQSPYKGISNLVEAWASNSIIKNNDKIHLIIAGKSNNIDYSPLQDISNVTIIDRRITDDEYIAISRLSDCIIMPYISISQSGVLLSALNEKIPIIVSHKGGLYEPLLLADIGWDIGEPNVKNICDIIIDLLNNPKEIIQKRDNDKGWNIIHENYSWKTIATQTFNIYKSVI